MHEPPKPIRRVRSFDEVLQQYDEERRVPGMEPIRLGFERLDNAIRGISPGQLCGVMARTGVGKTWVEVTIADNIATAQPNVGTLIATLEMPAVEWAERQLAIREDVDPETVERWSRSGVLAQHSRDFLDRMHNTLVCEDRLNLTDFPSVFQEARDRLSVPLRLVLIDYAGLIDADGRDIYERASKIGRELKMIAKQERVAIVVALQLNRAGGDGSQPVSIDMLRDSGALEESMDFIVGCWRPEKAPDISPSEAMSLKNVLRVRLLKNRKGPDGETVDLRFRPGSRRVDDEFRPLSAELESADA